MTQLDRTRRFRLATIHPRELERSQSLDYNQARWHVRRAADPIASPAGLAAGSLLAAPAPPVKSADFEAPGPFKASSFENELALLDRIRAARALLEDSTPLKADCGRRCGGACCKPDADGQGGMLLFPGEEALYAPAPAWATVAESAFVVCERPLFLLTCDGACRRAERPLSCRVFPLTPLAREGTVVAALDARAWPVCPLMEHGMTGLSPAFRKAAGDAFTLLWEDSACRAYMEALTTEYAKYTFL